MCSFQPISTNTICGLQVKVQGWRCLRQFISDEGLHQLPTAICAGNTLKKLA
jgi:hypothetical protein